MIWKELPCVFCSTFHSWMGMVNRMVGTEGNFTFSLWSLKHCTVVHLKVLIFLESTWYWKGQVSFYVFSPSILFQLDVSDACTGRLQFGLSTSHQIITQHVYLESIIALKIINNFCRRGCLLLCNYWQQCRWPLCTNYNLVLHIRWWAWPFEVRFLCRNSTEDWWST